MNGITLTVLVSQLPKLFGFSVHAEGFIAETQAFLQGLQAGETNPAALALGLGSLAVILGMKRWLPGPRAGILVAVVGSTVICGALGLAASAGVPVVGPLPQGLPHFTVPTVPLDQLRLLLPGTIAITLVAFADTSVLSRVCHARALPSG